ncbi:MAG: hypothetical protein JO166_10840 [Deltaproteobacteria bacterium]|nr:hypothetical protein [Deltaproteobacteria bacterium]
MNFFSAQIAAAIRAVVIHSDTCYSWLGRRLPALSRSIQLRITPKQVRGYLLYNLQNQLYADFYCHGLAKRRETEASRPLPGLTSFVQALSDANTGRGCYESGWLVSEVKDDEIVARKNGPEFRMSRNDCGGANGGPITPGASLTVHLPKEFLNMSPHFYLALGNEQLPTADATGIVRFYWNLTASGAVSFMHNATRLLNEAHLPFHLKVLRDPELYTRCDAGVLYAPKQNYDAMAEVLVKLYRLTAGKLKPSTPAFTKTLAPGLGLAESPRSTESFGEHRCALLANAMVLAHEHDVESISDRLGFVMQHFEREQINMDAPFLNPGSSDNYHWVS